MTHSGRHRGPASPDLSALTAGIEDAFPRLSPQLKLAARYVLDAPQDVALHSMRAVAARAGVHPSTMVRLAKELDFSGYSAFREPFRESLRSRPTHYAVRARHLHARGAAREAVALFGEARDTATSNIRDTFADTEPAALEAVAETLAGANRIYVVGMRKCYPVAFYFHYACRMFHDRTVLVEAGAGTFADSLRGLGPGDALLAIGFDPYTRETVRAARQAEAVGAAVIAVTDSVVSPLTAGAKHVFVVANAGPSFFRSLVAALALVETFVAFLVARGGRVAIEALSQTERHLENFDVYWHESARGGGT